MLFAWLMKPCIRQHNNYTFFYSILFFFKEININSYKPLIIKRIDLMLSKWEDLQKLKAVMPVDVHSCYDNFPRDKTFKTRKSKA